MIIGKIRFKNSGSSCYFLGSRGQKTKNNTEIEQTRLFLFTFLVSFFYGVSSAKTDLENKYMINSEFGSFLNKIIC